MAAIVTGRINSFIIPHDIVSDRRIHYVSPAVGLLFESVKGGEEERGVNIAHCQKNECRKEVEDVFLFSPRGEQTTTKKGVKNA